MSEKIVQLNEEIIKGQIKELVRGSVEETLNELLEKEAELEHYILEQALDLGFEMNNYRWCYKDIPVHVGEFLHNPTAKLRNSQFKNKDLANHLIRNVSVACVVMH